VKRLCCNAVLACLGILGFAAVSSGSDKHPLTLEELFRLEDIDAASISTDGSRVALVRHRPRLSGERYLGGRLAPHDREDVWTVELKTGTFKNLTHGAADGSSYWQPVWSPDSSRLLVLSDRCFDNIHLEMIDIRSGRMTRISKHGIDLEAYVNRSQTDSVSHSSVANHDPNPAIWVDNRRVIFVELAAGEVSFALSQGTKQIDQIRQNWARTESGKEPSFNRHDSIQNVSPRGVGALVMTNVDTGQAVEQLKSVIRRVNLSPDGRFASIISEGAPIVLHESSTVELPWASDSFLSTRNFHTVFEIVELGPKPQVKKYQQVVEPRLNNYHYDQIGKIRVAADEETYAGPIWFAHASKVAVLGGDPAFGDANDIYVVDAAHENVTKLPRDALAILGLVVIGDHVFARGAGASGSSSDHWYTHADDNAIQNQHMVEVPCHGELIPLSENIGVTLDSEAGRLTVIRDGRVTDFVESADIKNASVSWPNAHELSPLGVGAALLRTEDGKIKVVALSGTTVSIQSFAEELQGDALVFSSKTLTLVAVNHSSSETTVEFKTQQGVWQRLLSLNGFLKDVYNAPTRDLVYKATDGTDRSARLYLPPTYHPGGRVAMITLVYIGQRFDRELSNNAPYFDNLALAYQYGFAVLVPTINPVEYRFKFEPFKSLQRDIVPAVQAAIASGIVDSQRIYVLGHSYGAYSTYSIIEQTDVFAAAAAINGPSSLLADYLDIDPQVRYESWAFERSLSSQAELETDHDYIALGATPWKDFDRYTENSPVRYIDRIRTPLLIFHSDLDDFDMHQADNMFVGLERLGKEARYVRFWGEPHSLNSPANIRQFWQEMVEWFTSHKKT
jgi:dipeptidyl aminopeptidase/acylaminoacyl peptidase